MFEHEYEELQDIARELTNILIRRGAYNAKTIINEVNIAIKAIEKAHSTVKHENYSREEILNRRRYNFFVDCVNSMAEHYGHSMKDIISDARMLAENIYGKFPE
ncbi:hypothetical protein NPJJOOEL_00250 [Enterobacteria phage Brandy]|nr:hypothetical protein NPJJOOEL_00250 [Enterobacteria phage Brandy]